MEYIMLIASLIGLIFTAFWIKNPDNDNDLFFAIFSLIGCIAMISVCLFIIFTK